MPINLNELKTLYSQEETQTAQGARIEQACLTYFTEDIVKALVTNRDNRLPAISNRWGSTLDEDHFSSLSDRVRNSLQERFPGVTVEVTNSPSLVNVSLSGWVD